MAPHSGNARGFTLLEMLVALGLMSVLAAALYTSLHIGFRAQRSASAAVEPVRTAGLALELIRKDLATALPPRGILAGTFYAEDRTDESTGHDADTLVWYASAGELAEGRCDIVKLELAVATLADAGERALVRRVTTNLLAPKEPEPTEEVLCRRVTALNLRYFDGLAWLDVWDSTTADDSLPMAVEVTLEIERSQAGEDEAETYELSRVFAIPCGSAPSDDSVQLLRDWGF